MVRYTYDAWGNHTVRGNDGTEIAEATHIGNINPIRYRGYYFDTEIGFYYLQTRYYDPTTGRFVTIDGIAYADPESINGLNLYAYCGNNPVMNVDPDGTAWWQWLLFGIGAALVAAAAIVLTVVTGGAAATFIGAVAIGAAKGALIGAAVGSVVGIAGGAIYAGVTGANIGDSILSGFLIGFGIGAVVGAVIGGFVGGVTYTPSGLSKGAIKQAVKRVLADSKKMKHIMQPKHNLPSSAKAVGKLMKKTLIKGTVESYGKSGIARAAIWASMNSKVTFRIIGTLIMISDMWIF